MPTEYELEAAVIRAIDSAFILKARALIKQRASSGQLSELRASFATRYQDALCRMHAGDRSYWEGKFRHLLATRNWSLAEQDSHFVDAVALFERGGVDALRRCIAEIDGVGGTFEYSAPVSEASDRALSSAKPGESIIELFDKYAVQRLAEGRKREDTVRQDRKVVELFVSYLGSHRALRTITEQQVRAWRNVIALLPPGYTKRNEFEGLSIQEIADRARTDAFPRRSLTTVNKHLRVRTH